MDNIKDVVQNVIGQLSQRQTTPSEKIQRIWASFLTESERLHTQILEVSNGQLVVIVDSPAWLHQMRIRKRGFLEKLRQEISDIKDLKFKVGKVKN